MTEPIVRMKNVSFSYEDKPILKDINLDIMPGVFMGLVGPNGGGKTTLIRILLGLIHPEHGSIELFGEQINKFKDWNRIGYVSQKSNAFNRGFPATVYEVVAMGLTAKIGYLRFLKRKHKILIKKALEQVDMLDYIHQNIGDLSGGQQQRVFIARALVADPLLLILDEPTVGVDASNVKRFYDLLHKLNQDGITLLLITHDIGTMTEHATDIICLNKELHFHGAPDKFNQLTDRELSALYGHPLQVLTHEH